MDKNKTLAQIESEYDRMEAQLRRQDAMIAARNRKIMELSSRPLFTTIHPDIMCCRRACSGRPDLPLGDPTVYPKLRLNDCSWAEIAAYAADGLAPYYFSVGDAKTITLKDGTSLDVRIIGFNHDTANGGVGTLPITFETVQTLNQDYVMNDEWTNEGGWQDSKLRRVLNEDIFALLPDDLMAVIKPCVKTTSLGKTSEKMAVTVDKLFVLSEQEVFGRKIYSVGGEGHWYEWYRQEDNPYGKCKQNGEPDWRWERSPYGSNTNYFCIVSSYGNADNYSASGTLGVSFGFCI